MRYFMGIDPGKQGGFAIINEDFEIVKLAIMPLNDKEYDKLGIFNLLREYDLSMIVLENPNTIGGIGKASMASLSRCIGMLEGMIFMTGKPHLLPRPMEWQKNQFKGVPIQKKMKDGKKKNDPKATANLAARQAYPFQDFTKSPRAKNDHDGMVDALLLARYGVSYFKGELSE